jgi:sulfite reductase alpha subunit-like flavoprotein
MKDFQVYDLPLNYLIQGVGPLRPREYSISSAPGTQTLDLTAAITEYDT